MKNSDTEKSFTTPEGYFASLDERLRKIALPADKSDVFDVPENYFQKLHKRLTAIPNHHQVNHFHKTIRNVAAAIFIIGAIGSSFLFYSLNQPKITPFAFEIPTEEAAYYLSNYDMIEHAEIFEPYIEDEIIPFDGTTEFILTEN